MAVEKSYARLGFFVVLALIVILATAVFFIQRLKRHAKIDMVTYVTENVSSLDVSSPVRYRGVLVGRITNIRVDPRGTMIEIDFEVFLDRLNTIGLDIPYIRTITDIGGVFPNLRAEIVSNPLTGEGYLLLDVPANPPPRMELGFKPTRPYVPSMPSVAARVESKLPALLERANVTLDTLTTLIAQGPDSLNRFNRLVTNADRTVQQSQLPALSADSRKFLATTTEQIEQMKSDLHSVMGSQGELVRFSEDARAAIKAADLPAASQAARDAADSSRLAADDLRRSLPAIRDSLDQLRELTRMLEEQPESVIYGPRPEEKHR
jgi:paraquat-inducible protein B